MNGEERRDQGQTPTEPPLMEGDPVRVRNGVNKSIYLSKRAEGLVTQAAERFSRSDSAVLSILVERYLPRILADKRARI